MKSSPSSSQAGSTGRLSLLQAAAEVPDAIAWVLDGQAVSYGELAAALRSVLGGLVARGIGVESTAPVGVIAELDREALLLVYALFELGVPVVPLHPRFTVAERRTLLARAGAALLLDAAEIQGEPYDPPPPLPDDGPPLAILFTSGSSGTPKGVELSRAAFVASAAASAANLGWRPDDRWLLSLPYAHVGGLSVLTRCLIDRRTVVIAPLPRFEPSAVMATVEEQRVTLMSLVPTQLDRVLAQDPPLAPPPTLRALLLGGAPAAASLLRTAAAKGWPVLTTYGLTEACSQVATQRPGTPPDAATGSGPCLPGVEVRLDSGVIALRGPMLLTRYLPAGEYGPPCDAAGWFRTSDLGRLDEQGHLHVLGRADQVIVSGGEKIAPAEVEAALLAHPAVAAACVFGVPDPVWGQAVAAAIQPVAGQGLKEQELRLHLAQTLAPFKRPRRLAILPALPLLPSGKIDRRAVIELCVERLPEEHGR
jgi:O-succinylbenzoic acid--CoA ligase